MLSFVAEYVGRCNLATQLRGGGFDRECLPVVRYHEHVDVIRGHGTTCTFEVDISAGYRDTQGQF